MTTPTKLNDVTTPLSVQPGDPHWTVKNHDQVNSGQGYDYQDPVSLQRGGYRTGNAITMFGRVGFRADQIVANVDHGNVYKLELTRRFGTQGTFDFIISVDVAKSTGVAGNFRTDVEHGFDVCKIDLDFLALNPSLTAAGPGQFRVRMKDGESRKEIQVIAPYRTAVRTFDPVVLQKPLTYWVKELSHAWAGMDEATAGGQPDTHIYDNGSSGASSHAHHVDGDKIEWTSRPYNATNLEETANFLHKQAHYTSMVSRLNVDYKVLSLPLPTAFVFPQVGIPGAEYWKNQFPIYNHDELIYTVGNSYDTVVFARIYSYPSMECDIGFDLTAMSPTWNRSQWCAMVGNRWIYLQNWSEGSGVSLPDMSAGGVRKSGLDLTATMPTANSFVAGSDNSWTSNYDFTYGNHDHTGFQSKAVIFDTVESTDFWNTDYSTYDNPVLGSVITVGSPVEHVLLNDSSYNVMFNHTGVSNDSGLYDNTLTMYTSASSEITREDKAKGLPGGFSGEEAGAEYYGGRANCSTCGNWQGKPGYFSYVYEYNKTIGSSYGDWVTNNIDLSGQTGPGENGTSYVLYDLSNIAHDATTFLGNDNLVGYYKSCIDHKNREVHLVLSKADENDPVELDEVTTSAVYINKATTYDVGFHAEYDDTVNPLHAMDPAPVFQDFQPWDDTPTGSHLIDQIFVPDGADSNNQIQFISLEAGSLSGGWSPKSKAKKAKPAVAPTLTISNDWNTSTTIDSIVFPAWNVSPSQTVAFTVTMENTGDGDMTLYCPPNAGDDILTTSDPYDDMVSPPTGTKTDDITVTITGNPDIRRDAGNRLNSYVLSGGASLDVEVFLDVQSAGPGYEADIPYTIDKGSLLGISNGKISTNFTIR